MNQYIMGMKSLCVMISHHLVSDVTDLKCKLELRLFRA